VDSAQLDFLAFARLVERARRDWAAGRLEPALAFYRRAVGLARGNPLEDLPALQVEPAVASLIRLLQTVVLEYADTARALCRHEEVLPLLHRLAADNPLHELAHSRLMLALAGAGQQAEALRVYDRLRDHLADDLGLDPGNDLREAHLAILRGDVGGSGSLRSTVSTVATAKPAQLPAGPYGFVGRDRELAALDAISRARTGGGTRTIVLCGAAGVGKTTLAVRWARTVADRFPDGLLYADLGGFGPSAAPTPPGDVLCGLLQALGRSADTMPIGFGDRVGLYHDLLADRQVLIVLDNARDADQVRPLLPRSAGCVAVVVSRCAMAGLVAGEAAVPVVLEAMTVTEARTLLRQRLGADRFVAEPGAADVLIERCARLPLALAVAAARIATRPALRLSLFAEELRTEKILDVLHVRDAAADLRTVFSWSYNALGATAAELFVRLGSHPRREFNLPTAVALSGTTIGRVKQDLLELCEAHLITELSGRQYRMSGLWWAYAAELARQEVVPEPLMRATG
jgi:tetratricopeptide (TPR) repeat protein